MSVYVHNFSDIAKLQGSINFQVSRFVIHNYSYKITIFNNINISFFRIGTSCMYIQFFHIPLHRYLSFCFVKSYCRLVHAGIACKFFKLYHRKYYDHNYTGSRVLRTITDFFHEHINQDQIWYTVFVITECLHTPMSISRKTISSIDIV